VANLFAFGEFAYGLFPTWLLFTCSRVKRDGMSASPTTLLGDWQNIALDEHRAAG